MAKRANTTTITNRPDITPEVNANFEAVNEALENTLSLDGSTPNSMGADLDMNNNDILNAKDVNTANLYIGGTKVVPTDVAKTAVAITKEYDTVAELLADTATYTAGLYFHVIEGDFYYKSVASGGDVTNAGSQQFEVLPGLGNRVCPEQWAENTTPGTTDMTTAVQAVLDYAETNRAVAVLNSRYAVSSTIYLRSGTAPTKGEWRIETPGEALTGFTTPQGGLVWRGASNGTILEINESQNCKIGLLSLWNDQGSATGVTGVKVRNRDSSGAAIIKSSILDGFAIDGCKYGVILGDYTNDGYDSNVDDVRIKNLHFYRCANPLLIDSVNQDNIVVDKFWNGGPSAPNGGAGETRDYIIRTARGGNGFQVRHLFSRVDAITADNAAIDIQDGHFQCDFASFEGTSATGNLVQSGVYQWTLSGSGTSEYYLEANGGGDPSINLIDTLDENSSAMTSGTLGSLTAGQFAYGDNDTLGFETVYVRLSDSTDPDTKADGYIDGYMRAQCRVLDLLSTGGRNKAVIRNLSASEGIQDTSGYQATLSHWAGTVLVGCDFSSGNVLVTRQVMSIGTTFFTDKGFVESGGNAFVSHFGTATRTASSATLDTPTITGKMRLGDVRVLDDYLNPSASSTRLTRYTRAHEISSTIADSTATDVFTLTVANGSHVSVKVDWHCFRASAAARNFSAGGTWRFDVTVDNAGNVAVSSVSVTDETQALDGFSSLTVTPSTTTGAGTVTLKVTQANNQTDTARFGCEATFMGNTGGIANMNFDKSDVSFSDPV